MSTSELIALLSTFDNETINSAVERMSDNDILNILLEIEGGKMVETFIKCDKPSLDRIYKIMSNNADKLIIKYPDERTSQFMEFAKSISMKTMTDDDYIRMYQTTSSMIEELTADNARCLLDIKNMSEALEITRSNFIMYKDDLTSECKSVCIQKMEHTLPK